MSVYNNLSGIYSIQANHPVETKTETKVKEVDEIDKVDKVDEIEEIDKVAE